jgi:hypothetical protein
VSVEGGHVVVTVLPMGDSVLGGGACGGHSAAER